MNEQPYFIGTDSDGRDVRYDVICAFDSDETHKSYLIYTKPEPNAPIEYSIYDIVDDELLLRELETERDEEIVRDLVEQLK